MRSPPWMISPRPPKMQKASLYHYFESKQKILVEMVDLEVGRWGARIPEYEKGKDLKETLEIIATTFLKDMEDPARREFFKILHLESHNNPFIFKTWKESPMQNRQGFYSVFAKHLAGRLSGRKSPCLSPNLWGRWFIM